MPTTRCKMRCNEIRLARSSYATGEEDEQGRAVYAPFDQPTVVLGAVTGEPGASEENKTFWSATPMGSVTLTISNPSAAETFELGREYYVDFSLAD